MNAPSLQSKKLAQVAIVVRDIEASAERYAKLLGVPKPTIHETAGGEKVSLEYRGASSDARAKLAFFELGDAQLELIEPIGEDSAWAEGLRDGGESVHHIAFWTENMAAEKRALEATGAPLIMRGNMMEEAVRLFRWARELWRDVRAPGAEAHRSEIELPGAPFQRFIAASRILPPSPGKS